MADKKPSKRSGATGGERPLRRREPASRDTKSASDRDGKPKFAKGATDAKGFKGEKGFKSAQGDKPRAARRDKPLPADIILRARAPMLEGYQNLLSTNAGWLTYVDRAQTEADRIDRYTKAKDRLSAVTAADLQALARRYLTATGGVEVTVLPEGAAAP